jgi:hypothetical protein
MEKKLLNLELYLLTLEIKISKNQNFQNWFPQELWSFKAIFFIVIVLRSMTLMKRFDVLKSIAQGPTSYKGESLK